MNRSLFLALSMLALAFLLGGHTAEHAAIRATVYQCVRSILRQIGVH